MHGVHLTMYFIASIKLLQLRHTRLKYTSQVSEKEKKHMKEIFLGILALKILLQVKGNKSYSMEPRIYHCPD